MINDLSDAELLALGRRLSSERPKLPEEAQGHASNLIEQIDNYLIEDAAGRALLVPHMLRSLVRLEATRQG